MTRGYLRAELERHRRERPDDLLTTMLDLTGDDAMTEAEIRSATFLLLVAGDDTTANTKSNCLIALETKVALAQLLRIGPEYRLRDVDFGSSRFIRGPERGVVDVGVGTA